MKTFLNVLYRRILYKIPLKFLLILLGICALFFASVNAGYENISRQTIIFSSSQTYFEFSSNGDIFCIMPYQNLMDGTNFKIAYLNGGFDNNNNLLGNVYAYNSICFNESIGIEYKGTAYSSNKLYLFSGFSNLVSSCDYSGYLTQFECDNLYSGYVLESSIDSNYCENNNLCPVYTGECENSSGLNWSSLYINNIQHIGGPNIYIDIPEELSRDYDYIDEDMYIDIEGYNVDYDKITGIIDVQNYKPSQEDFNNIIGILADYMPIIVIFLGLLFIYKMIRKPFKSKL